MKGYFQSNPFTVMTIPEEDGCSSASISPHMEEDPILSFPSSQNSFYVPTSNQGVTGYVSEYSYYPSQTYHSSTAEHHPSMLYTNSPLGGHPFFSPTAVFTTTPSPSSSISSTSIQNFATNNPGPMYYNSNYSEGGYQHAVSESSGSDFDSEQKEHQKEEPSCSYTTAPDHGFDESHHSSNVDVTKQHKEKEGKNITYNKRQVREKSKKRCSNCHANRSPSWRRSVSKYSKGELLCNACGLYEKTAKKKRMLVVHEDGVVKVIRKRDARDYSCSTCHTKDVTRWRRVNDSIKCERCARRSKL